MRNLAALLVVLSVSACGPEWDGAFSGTLKKRLACSGGPATEEYVEATAHLVDGDSLAVTFKGEKAFLFSDCDLTAKPDGETATIEQKVCAAKNTDQGTVTTTFTGGTIAINGDMITVGISANVQFGASGLSETCPLSVYGTMAR